MKLIKILVTTIITIMATLCGTMAQTYQCPHCGTMLNLALVASQPVAVPVQDVVLVVGDSISALGQPVASPRTTWPQSMHTVSSNWSNAIVKNYAVSGLRTTEALTNLTTILENNKLKPGQKGYVFVWLGINDFPDTGVTYNNLKAIWCQARSNGFKVAAFTITRGGGFTPENGWYQKWDALNNQILSDPSLYDALCRPDKLFPVPVDPAYFLDGIHPTPLGAQMIAKWTATNMEGHW